MYRIQCDSYSEIEIKKSRFLTYLHRCEKEDDAKAYITTIKKQHPNATHHCYAFIIGAQKEIQRSNDDGEPAGTAGVPMLECLNRQQMQDIVAVTVRYFGGIKLGTGGLIRAYSGSVANALHQAVLTQKQQMQKCTCTFSYELIGKIDHLLRSEQILVLEKDYQEQVTYTLLCKTIPRDALSQLSGGQIEPILIGEEFIDVPISDPNPS